MIGRMNHIGIATPRWRRRRHVSRSYGAVKIGKAFVMEAQGVRVLFCRRANTQLELIEPYGEKSPIRNSSRRIRRRPASRLLRGADIIAARDDMVAKGATVLNNGEPRIGAHGTPVIFLTPRIRRRSASS